MKRIAFLAISAVAAFTSACTSSYPASAAEMPNVMIMGEDSDADTVPRNSRVFKRVLNALSEELNNDGFNVYDETAVSLDDFAQGRVRRTDAEIIDIARSVKRPPIDVATIFSIYASASKMSYTTKIRTRVEGRLLNVKTGQHLGNFEVELPQPDNAPADCNRECVLETVGKNAKILAQDLGAVLTTKLAHIVDGGSSVPASSSAGSDLPTAYSLVFNGFNTDEINRIEEYMVAFSGYKHHRPTSSSMRHNEYWYETQSESGRLNRNFRRMLEHLGVEGRVAFSGSQFQIEKISLRQER
ncbi:MAG: hypothetical protein HQL35_04320 [Alphaproteobacteria bacterium]|nr:hypothetical protein [Alphaproteobacteria bacterium]